MSEIPARYGNPLPPAPKPDPRNERPDNRVLKEYLEDLERSKSSEIESTPTSEPAATSPSSAASAPMAAPTPTAAPTPSAAEPPSK